MSSQDWLLREDLRDLLATAELTVEGRLSGASNTTLRCVADTIHGPLHCVVKPVSGERPLWDFPNWTLSRRELAAYELSEAVGWQLVPPTAWREDGPGGEGMCQLWIDEDPARSQVRVVRGADGLEGFLHVLDAEDGAGRPVQLLHGTSEPIVRLTVFDAIVNNADRKGGHVITDEQGRIWGIDHGVTFAVEEKLRTVLWGWAGEDIPEPVLADLERLDDLLGEHYDPVDRWLAYDEREALRERIALILRSRAFPLPSGRWPAIPWPVF